MQDLAQDHILLTQSTHYNLTFSLFLHQLDEDLSEKVQEIIKKRMKDWMSLISKHGPVALSCCESPWDLPNSEELDLVFNESEFAAWCLVHGYTPSCLAMSVNEMQYSRSQVLASPIEVNLKDIKEFIQDDYLYVPPYRDQINVELRLYGKMLFWNG